MRIFNQIVISFCLLVVSWQIAVVERVTSKIFEERMMKELNNTHFFILTLKGDEMQHMVEYIQSFKEDHKIEIYRCNPSENKEICPLGIPMMLIINTIRINFNGRHQSREDYQKWVKFRVTEYPERLHSIEELREHAQDKNEVFCFIDRQGQELSRKQYIFIATAKKLHFLYYCSLDASIGRQIGLKYGHLAMIRKDLSFNFDFWSEKTPEESEKLHQLWLNFLITSCESQFRIENRDKSHDLVRFECDLSLECEEQMMEILKYELIWRQKHPEINFSIKILHTTSGQLKSSRNIVYDLPIIRFGKTMVYKKIQVQESGAVLEETDYERDLYMQTDPKINEDTIDVLLKAYSQKKLIYVIRESETDIRTLDGAEGAYHRELKRKQQEANEQL